jgi:arginyl-tRNA synthetase
MGELARDAIESALEAALNAAQEAETLPRVPTAAISVERPQNPEHGDYASNIALRLASTMKRKPLEVAEAIAAEVATGPMIEAVAVAPPGFINVRLSQAWKLSQIDAILATGPSWGSVDVGQGKRVQVEFVSANPTGPLQVGNGRGAVLGDALASVLGAAGYEVEREYYVNDAGGQIRTFVATLSARYQQQFGRDVDLPEDGYLGAYVVSLAEQIKEEDGEQYLVEVGEPPPEALGRRGLAIMLEAIGADLSLLGVEFDQWFSEQSLFEADAAQGDQSTYEVTMGRLREAGFIAEDEGAVWFRSTKLGEEKDNVLVRRTGEPTYFASDIAYHYDKFVRRGFDWVIDIWGADHQGHVTRTKAATEAVGGPPGGLDVLLYQLVHLRRGEERVRMSKRTGEIVTLRELLEDVGRDVTRYFLLQRSADAQMDFDLELATSQDPKQNPVSYVQYAHARCASIGRTAEEVGIAADGDVQQLGDATELLLIDAMLRLPELVEMMAEKLEPHHLTTYAMELAQHFTQFYGACRVVDLDAPDRSRARLKLTLAAQQVLARTLGLMGVSAPESM